MTTFARKSLPAIDSRGSDAKRRTRRYRRQGLNGAAPDRGRNDELPPATHHGRRDHSSAYGSKVGPSNYFFLAFVLQTRD
jgi:hypothetical protein